MKKLYTNENRMIVFNLKNVLDSAGIATVIMNEFSSGGTGDLATFDTWPELWIEDERDLARAEAILENILSNNQRDYWYCRSCQEKNDSSFEVCWNCGSSSDLN